MIRRRARPADPAAVERAILKDGLRPNELRDQQIRKVILSIPKGRVATYAQVAAAAGYPMYQRLVARILSNGGGQGLPWQRVLGAGGEIRLRGTAAYEQRVRLEQEGVQFKGRRVDMERFQHRFRTWDLED